MPFELDDDKDLGILKQRRTPEALHRQKSHMTVENHCETRWKQMFLIYFTLLKTSGNACLHVRMTVYIEVSVRVLVSFSFFFFFSVVDYAFVLWKKVLLFNKNVFLRSFLKKVN